MSKKILTVFERIYINNIDYNNINLLPSKIIEWVNLHIEKKYENVTITSITINSAAFVNFTRLETDDEYKLRLHYEHIKEIKPLIEKLNKQDIYNFNNLTKKELKYLLKMRKSNE